MSKFIVCPQCEGRGGSTAYLGAFTQSDMEEMEDTFIEYYFGGRLDRPCEVCKGEKVISSCSVAGCKESPVTQTRPWHDAFIAENCYEHLNEEESDMLAHISEQWSEYRAGC